MNNHMKLKITLLIMAFLLLVAAIVYIMAPPSVLPAGTPDPYTLYPVSSSNPVPPAGDPTPYPSTPTPYSPTPTPYVPTPTPYVPTPTPFVPTPDPVGQPLGRGTIASTTPWLLNILAD